MLPFNLMIFQSVDRQCCRRDVDDGVKKDMWSAIEDFSKTQWDKVLNKLKTQYEMFVDFVDSKQVSV